MYQRFNSNTIQILLFLLLLTFSACVKRNLNPNEYINWIEDPKHGLRKEKIIGDYIFTIQYRPSEYIALKELSNSYILTKQLVESKAQSYNGYHQIVIQIASRDNKTPLLKNRISNENEYYNRLNYFVSFAQNDLMLIDGKDTLPCSLYHFEQTYNITPFDRLITAFQLKNEIHSKNDLTLIFNDNILGVGKVKIKIEGSILKKIPKLHI